MPAEDEAICHIAADDSILSEVDHSKTSLVFVPTLERKMITYHEVIQNWLQTHKNAGQLQNAQQGPAGDRTIERLLEHGYESYIADKALRLHRNNFNRALATLGEFADSSEIENFAAG
jgi:hypothetical protein